MDQEFQAKLDAELGQKFFDFNGCAARGKYGAQYDVPGTNVARAPQEPSLARHGSVQSESTVGYGTANLKMSNTPDLSQYKL